MVTWNMELDTLRSDLGANWEHYGLLDKGFLVRLCCDVEHALRPG